MLAGLCNLCDEFGHANFDTLCSIFQEVSKHDMRFDSAMHVKTIRQYQTFLKTQFSKMTGKHSPCAELCSGYALGTCSQSHTHVCPQINEFYSVCSHVSDALEHATTDTSKLKEDFHECVKAHWKYAGHLIRTKHQSHYYQYVLRNLKVGQCVVVVDYKMKLELGKRMREIQRDWYGKRGISIFGFYVIAKVADGQRKAEIIDLWCEDTKQDTWFSQSAMDVGFTWMETAFPGFDVYLFSGRHWLCFCGCFFFCLFVCLILFLLLLFFVSYFLFCSVRTLVLILEGES